MQPTSNDMAQSFTKTMRRDDVFIMLTQDAMAVARTLAGAFSCPKLTYRSLVGFDAR